jgi:hypothetical protein
MCRCTDIEKCSLHNNLVKPEKYYEIEYKMKNYLNVIAIENVVIEAPNITMALIIFDSKYKFEEVQKIILL